MRMPAVVLLGGILAAPPGCGPAESPRASAVTQTERESRPPETATDGPGSADKVDGGETVLDSRTDEPLVPPIVLSGEPPATSPVPDETAGHHSGLSEGSPLLDADFSSDPRAHFHPHGNQVCASGCAVSNHPTAKLTPADFRRLMSEFAVEPLEPAGPALDALLYYGRQTRAFVEQFGTSPVSDARAAVLGRELARAHARISFRVVDERGIVRTHMPPTRVPLDRRHVFEMEVNGLQPLETSGTVKRVGLDYLWTRI